MNVKYSIQLPEWYDWKLKVWAKFKGTTRATLSANILQARIEANWNDLEKDIQDAANRLSVSKEQFIDGLLQDEDKD